MAIITAQVDVVEAHLVTVELVVRLHKDRVIFSQTEHGVEPIAVLVPAQRMVAAILQENIGEAHRNTARRDACLQMTPVNLIQALGQLVKAAAMEITVLQVADVEAALATVEQAVSLPLDMYLAVENIFDPRTRHEVYSEQTVQTLQQKNHPSSMSAISESSFLSWE
jgi:hypothetical protein